MSNAIPFDYYCFDLETTCRTSYKRKANMFDPSNWIVASGAERNGDPAQRTAFYWHALDKRPFDWFTRMLNDSKILVGVNIKFDILYAVREPKNLEAWMDFVAKGGSVWDCQLAEYLLHGMTQENHMLSMDEMVVRYGGSLKQDEVKTLWAAGWDTPDIPQDTLMTYLMGGKHKGTEIDGDIGNTRIIFQGQYEKAKKAGQMRSIWLNMGSLLATIEMERNGMFVDRARGIVLAAELAAECEVLRTKIEEYIPEEAREHFSWSSRFHKSALIFGGAMKYSARENVLDEAGKPVYFKKDELHYVLQDGSTVECAWYEHVRDTEWRGEIPDGNDRVVFKSGKNKGGFKTKTVKADDVTRGAKSHMADKATILPGFTEAKKSWESSTPGYYSTAADVIEELGDRDIPFLKDLAKLARMTKDLSTYYIVGEGDKAKGMLTMVQPDSIIHHKINHTSTVTARFSSSDPNLQNVPKGGKSAVKTVFISRFGEHGMICQSDFSALEVYVQAILTKCKQLIEDLRLGLDMHCVRVAQKEHIPYEEAYDKCKVQELPEWDAKRSKAKQFSFQRAYGAGKAKIAVSTGMPEDEVQALIDAEEARYPEISGYYIQLTERIMASRWPTSKIVDHPDFPGLKAQLGRGEAFSPDGKRYIWSESCTPKFMAEKGTIASFSPTEIKNYMVQGEGGEWAKAAMWLAVRMFYTRRNFGGLALLVNQVHDALYGDFHKDVAIEAAGVLHACMEEASTFMEYFFKWEIPVHVPSDTTLGANMMIEDKVTGDEFKEHATKTKAYIRANFLNDYQPLHHD